MKSMFSITFMLALAMFACSKEDGPTPAETPAEVAGALRSGSWQITYFWDSDHEETQHFTGYEFTFGNEGILSASNGMVTVDGTWSTGSDDSRIQLIINFTSPAEFEELSDDWHVLDQTENKIRLEDVSGGNGGTDYLTFEKL